MTPETNSQNFPTASSPSPGAPGSNQSSNRAAGISRSRPRGRRASGRRVWRNSRRDGVGKTRAFHSASSTLWVIWTRPANSHTGQQQTIAASQAGQMAASDYAPPQSRSFLLPRRGRPQMKSRPNTNQRPSPVRVRPGWNRRRLRSVGSCEEGSTVYRVLQTNAVSPTRRLGHENRISAWTEGARRPSTAGSVWNRLSLNLNEHTSHAREIGANAVFQRRHPGLDLTGGHRVVHVGADGQQYVVRPHVLG